ncbi:MAG TPA: ABC transporter permease [Alphaproteobacteria bacterium]|jgi:peptide/nickel transport system permease protein|nr:ABC transporter permease [Alphaproteobacteria bacterium]
MRHTVLRFIASRLLQTALVLLAMSFVVYLLIGLMPGDPIDLMISGNPRLTPDDVARLRAVYGLDQPLWSRYLAWLGSALSGDLGASRLFARPVLEVMGPFLVNTCVLMGVSFVLSIVIAIPLGVWAARKPGSLADRGINAFAFAGISMPVFWLGLMLIIVFSVLLSWFPASGTGRGGGWFDAVRSLMLPVITLTIHETGVLLRYTRSAMIETMRQDFIRAIRAKGASESWVMWRHALPNAMLPVVTVIALSFGGLFSGALVTETIFAYPGMGRMIYDSVMGNDFNLALIGLLLATVLTLAANLAADLLYAWLDPRIRLGDDR